MEFKLNEENIVDVIVLVVVYWYLLGFFDPGLMLAETITAGGDTASHYYPAEYMRDYLLPNWHLSGWCPGNYAGFPIFQFYFPIAFLLMAVMGYVIPLQISFKLVTVLGTFLLPLMTYLSMRAMKFRFPTPILAATFTLCLLFLEANSMWGGNIPSTLAGEFTYSLSMSLAVLFMGTLYRGIEEKKYVIHNAVLMALISLTHVYTLLFVLASSAILLILKERSEFRSRLEYMAKTYILAFLLSAFFTVPLAAKLGHTTAYDLVWHITDVRKLVPTIMLPQMLVILGALVLVSVKVIKSLYSKKPRTGDEGDIKRLYIPIAAVYLLSLLGVTSWLISLHIKDFPSIESISNALVIPAIMVSLVGTMLLFYFSQRNRIVEFDPRVVYLGFAMVVGAGFYGTARYLGVVDIRFVPFIHLFMMFVAAYLVVTTVRKLNAVWMIPLIIVFLTMFWVNDYNVITDQASKILKGDVGNGFNAIFDEMMKWNYNGFTPAWIKWNYEGFERKSLWPQFSGVNEFLRGDQNDPRVVYEHSDHHNAAGTTRAYESLPLFSGRSTLEGLYMQSITSAPFVFYIQAEIGKQQSCPFYMHYPCTQFNLVNGTEHLKMFNVKHLIARSDEAKNALDSHPEYTLVKKIDPYSVYELTTNSNHYVTVPEYEPMLFKTHNWKDVSYDWFRNSDLIGTPLVFVSMVDKSDEERFKFVVWDGSLDSVKKIPLDNSDCIVHEYVGNEFIDFNTTCPGKPHLISMSYFPNWQVDGADKVYLVSPSFMLVYPNTNHVRLHYSKIWVDWLGILLSTIGVLIIIYAIFSQNQSLKRFFSL